MYVIYLKRPLTKLSLKYVCVVGKISAFRLCLTPRVTLRSLAGGWDPPQSSKCSIHSLPALPWPLSHAVTPRVRHSWWGPLPQTLPQLSSKPTSNRGDTEAELHSGCVTLWVLMTKVLETFSCFLIRYESEAWMGMCLKHLWFKILTPRKD